MNMRFTVAIALTAAGLLASSGPVVAQSCSTNKIGTFTYTNCSDGSSATTSQVGSFGYTNYSDGTSSTRTQIGNYGYTNYSDGTTATTSRVGNYGYTNYSDGTTATTVRIGDYLYTTYSDGTTVTTWVGNGSSQQTNVTPANFYSSPPAVPVVVNTDPGIRFETPDSYGNTYLAQGTLVRSDRSPAIYIVWAGQLHAFQTWDSYLRAGGRPDLSNVLRYGALGSYLTSLIGSPVPA